MNALKRWIPVPVKDRIKQEFFALRYRYAQKVFCIGFNKTGTTSLSVLFSENGFIVAPQRPAEALLTNCLNKDYEDLFRFVKRGGQFFQDIPFSLPDIYKVLAREFPRSKFILSVRDNPDQWYNSMVRFHSKVFANGERTTAKHLQAAEYVYKGYAWEFMQSVFGVQEEDPYNKQKLVDVYTRHIEEVHAFFSTNPERLIQINVAQADSTRQLSDFLGVPLTEKMPWANKT